MQQQAVFHYFPELQDDIIVSILAFVVDCPYERSSDQTTSAITHCLPFVCKKFNAICRESDILWKILLKRLIDSEPELWGNAVQSFVDANATTTSSSTTERQGQGLSTRGSILDRAGESTRQVISSLRDPRPTYYGIYGELFKFLLARHIRYTSPIFYMPGYVQIGEDIGLHFFEPRYRRLIRELMDQYPKEFREGLICSEENGLSKPPTFIYANRAPLDIGVMACIVQVVQCHIYENGTADVVLRPIEHARIEQLWVEHDHLYTTRVMRLRKEEQAGIEMNDIRSMHPNLTSSLQRNNNALRNLLRALGADGEMDDEDSDEMQDEEGE